jgi:hypothetical protein
MPIKEKYSVSRTIGFDWHKRFRVSNRKNSYKEERGYTDVVDVNRRDFEIDRRFTVRAKSTLFESTMVQ